jgi:hypothetical protein
MADLEEKTEKTANTAPDAEDKGQMSDSPTDDGTGQKTTPPEVELDDNGKPLPFDKHPKWIAARQAEKSLRELMEKNDVDSIEDLRDLAESGKKVVGKISDVEDIDQLIEKAKKLDEWTAYYEKKAEQERRDAETPEETIARQDKENAELRKLLDQDYDAKKADAEMKSFSKTVESTVSEILNDLPESQKPFITEFFGVNNPFAVIDIGDKRAVKKMIVEGKKKIEAFKTQVIKDYIAGKDKIPTVTKTGESSSPKTIRKTMATARAAMHERLDHLFG